MLKTPPSPPVPTAPSASGHAEGVSNDEFRAALSRLAAGVVLVTSHEPPLDAEGPAVTSSPGTVGPGGTPARRDITRGEDVGMTATAFMSVSLDPPLVLVSLREGSRMDDLLAEQPLWGVSVLAESQRHIAGRFAMKGRISDRLLFEDIPYARGEASGALLVGGALATLECSTERRVPAGDHTLVIGRVLSAQVPSAEGGPLMYFRGRYRHLD
ncbi:flavin reductase family protein [Streptomyces sp. NPDC003631]|uniref:flavin reductase family protein n=1 Tax=Streptomyces TaxID=1883 RepID=UPI002EB53346|nr:flavin reductase family protein [Streptomyces sp. WAC07094]